MNIGTNQQVKISQIVVETKSGLVCAYPGGAGLRNFKKDPSKSFLKAKSNPFLIYRNQKSLLDRSDKSQMTYVAPLYGDGNFGRGYISLQLEQDYTELVPKLLF